MVITALPQETVRLLGSSVNIVNPVSLVKELVDNAIDAKATSIEVNLTPDTVERLWVRDNGFGINIADFQALGCRAHTSKLRSFDELQTIGGKTLGFRGDALASANSLASVKITTRTADDPVAWLLQLRPCVGGVDIKQPVSGTVGTTVQITKLFDNIPVRKQNAMKESTKSIASIKRLLQSYSLARPNIKLALKIRGEPNRSWSYSPGTVQNVREAALQVFDVNLVSQCVEVVSSLDSSHDREVSLAGTSMVAFLPKATYDVTAVKDKGSFISVDSRPISSTKGVGKKLYAIFKSTAVQNRSSKSTKSLPSPFMQLNIECTPGSYDPNITPMKDDVLFSDEQRILDAFQFLCDKVYRCGYDSVRGSVKPGILGDQKTLTIAHPAGINSAKGPESVKSEDQLHDTKLMKMLINGTPPEEQGVDSLTNQTAVGTKADHPESELNRGGKNGPGRVQAMMRTVRRVNMARKDSNTSDQNGDLGLLPVQIPPRRNLKTKSILPKSPARLKASTLTTSLEDIGRYRKPLRDEPLEIAADETATPEVASAKGSPHPYELRENSRRPLEDLSSSTLNQIREDISEDSSSSSEQEVPYARNTLLGGLDSSPLREDLHTPRNSIMDNRSRYREQISTPSRNSEEQLIPRHSTIFTAVGLTTPYSRAILQTPPMSNPTQGAQRFIHDFRMPERVRSPSEYSRLRHHIATNGVSPTGNRLHQTRIQTRTDGLRRRRNAVISSRLGPTVERDSQILANKQLIPRVGRYEGIRDCGHKQGASHQIDRWLSHFAGDDREEGLMEQPKSSFNAAQALLMRTPASEEPIRKEPCVSQLEGETELQTSRCNTLSSLSTTPADKKLHHVFTKISIELADVQRRMIDLVKVENLHIEDFTQALRFKDMEEACHIEVRLQHIVDTWAVQTPCMDVEYTFRTKVKGKSQV